MHFIFITQRQRNFFISLNAKEAKEIDGKSYFLCPTTAISPSLLLLLSLYVDQDQACWLLIVVWVVIEQQWLAKKKKIACLL